MRTSFFLISFAATCALGASEFVIHTDKNIYEEGESISVFLLIKDAKITPSIRQPEHSGLITLSHTMQIRVDAPDTFSHAFSVEAGKAGTLVLGPYSLKIGDQTFYAAPKKLTIVPVDAGNISATFNQPGVAVGQTFHLTISSKRRLPQKVLWKDNELAHFKGQSSKFSHTTKNMNASSKYSIVIDLKAVKEGVLEVSPKSFEELPEDIDFEPVSIIITP